MYRFGTVSDYNEDIFFFHVYHPTGTLSRGAFSPAYRSPQFKHPLSAACLISFKVLSINIFGLLDDEDSSGGLS